MLFRTASGSSLVEGVVIRDHGGQAFVPHGSNGITFRDCITFDGTGYGYWWDRDTRQSYPENASFDITYEPALVDCILSEPGDKLLALGAIDGRNTKLDDIGQVAAIVERVAGALETHGVKEMHLQPSCGLEFLPRDRAKRKLELMREIAGAAAKAGAT